MKRYVLFLGLLLCCILLKAQSVNYTCRYWFDQNHAQALTTTFCDSTWHTELDIGPLTEGIHKLRLQVTDTSMKWSSPQTYLFFKTADSLQEGLTCRYWFDQNHAQIQQLPFGNGNLLLNVADIEDGLHTVNILLDGEKLTTTQIFSFVKVAVVGLDTLDTSRLVYHCWFDQDYEHQQTDSLGDGHILLDVDGLANGLHTVNVMLESSVMSAPVNYMFMKVAVQDPTAEVQYHCWFDNDYSTIQTGLVGSGIFELEVGDLSNGLHTANILVDNGTQSVPQCYLFYKRPVGGYIAKWEYWLNGEINNRYTSNLSPCVDTLSIITLLPVETQPIRSTCFHFHPNGDEPYINAKNEITLRFWDAESHFIDKSALYIDENVSETIVADTLERNTTVSMDSPRDNQIHWFKLGAGRGDYLSFKADKACSMQLFAPSGEEVCSASGPESILMNGFNVWEDGTYYLAVHDVTGSGETVSVTYNWLNRYAVVSYDVHLVGNGGCSTITFQGNGFNSLLDAYLVNYQNDTIRQLDIGHESNTTTTISFNFYEENLGVYDAVFEFYGETIRINGALEVQEPVDILLTTTVSYPSTFLINTPCTYTYTITNNGNMSAYAVPIYVYVSSQTIDGISHLEIDGLDLPSIIDGIDMDSLSVNEKIWFQEWADEMGEDHYFFKIHAIDENTGDSIFVRSNYFFVILAPYETKTFTIKVTADEPLNIFVTVPNDIVLPFILGQNRGFGDYYCCVKERISCVLSAASLGLDLTSMFGGWSSALVNCIVSVLENLNNTMSAVFCEGNDTTDFWDLIHSFMNLKSIMSMLVSCGKKFIPGANPDMLKVFEDFLNMLTLGTLPVPIVDCIDAFSKPQPNCPPGSPQGGGSGPGNPFDPNDIHGYLSESGSHYMRQEIQNVQYEIEFENDTTLATAAAHTIIVRDTLDATKFDLNSLAARSVTIGDKRLDLNGEQTFARTLDLRPEIYVIAQIEQDYDPTTGIVEWTIQSLDPMTMEPTDDPNQGVLPVNFYGDGVGFIDYSIDIKEAFADGTEISNRAGIIFDQEEVIMTPTWTNIIDAVKPTSKIVSVEAVNDSLSFSFVSEDNRSGVWYHTLYYRNDSTQMEWQVKKAQILGNGFMLNPELLTTEYLVMAVDSAGNREEKEMVAEYIYYYDGPSATTQANALAQGWNWWSTYIEQDGIDGMSMLQNSLGHNGLTIKSQNDFTDNYYQDIGYDYWYGSLETLTNEQGYLINVLESGNASMTGMVATPANHPITIQPNWNWIGYPVAAQQVVGNALFGFNAAGDDVIKGQFDFASYYEGYGWYPDDFALMPGQSYLYQSTASESKTLVYSNGNRGMTVPMRRQKPYWTSNPFAYPDNLNVMAVVAIDSVELQDEHWELGAFVNGECRGSARLRYFAPQERYYAMLTVAGQDGDLVEFRLANTESRDMEETCNNLLVFSKNAVVGSLKTPYTIHVGTSGDCYQGGGLLLFPNPVGCNQAFSVDIPQNETVEEILISDVLGSVVRHETGAIKTSVIRGLPVSGVYVIKATTKSGNAYYGKLIVE